MLRPADLHVYERATGKRVLVHVTKSGTRPNADVMPVAISANGRFVVFSSSATNLAAPSAHATCVKPTEFDPVGAVRSDSYRYPCPDLYVTDRSTGTTERVTVRNSNFPRRGTYISYQPAFISPDGRVLAFTSSATNLIAGRDTNHAGDVFLSDLKTHTTTLISVAH
jgi:hypothetical protein